MKKVGNHLGEIIVAVACVALLISSITVFNAPISNFFTGTTDKLVALGNSLIGGINSNPDIGIGGEGDDAGDGSDGSSSAIELESAEDIYALSRILATNYSKNKYYAEGTSLSLEDDFNNFEIPSELTTDAEKIAYLQTASYELTSDVELVLNNSSFLGIGSPSYEFKGDFDGNNKTITLSSSNNLATNSQTSDYIGLFSETLDAKIVNTKVKVSSDMTATSSATGTHKFSMGGLVGYAETTNITNCSIDFSDANFGMNISADEITDTVSIGGLVGSSERSVFNGCHVTLNDSSIYAIGKTVNKPYEYGGVVVGGLVGNGNEGSDNTDNLGRLGTQVYNCTVVSNNTSQKDAIYASIDGGTECTVGGLVGIFFNNGLIKNCSLDITKGNIVATQSEDTATSALGTAVGGIVGRMEHTGQIIGCNVTGDYLNMSTTGPDNTHLVGGIVGNAFGPIHRELTPILNCHFDGSGTSTIAADINTANLKASSHQVAVGGVAGYLVYQMYDSSAKDVKIINKSSGMTKDSRAGELVGVFEAACHSNGTWTPGLIEVDRCTSSGITFDLSSNVVKTIPQKVQETTSGKNLLDISKLTNCNVIVGGKLLEATNRVTSAFIYLEAGTYCCSTVGTEEDVRFAGNIYTYSSTSETSFLGAVASNDTDVISTGTRNYRTFTLTQDCYIRIALLPTATSSITDLSVSNIANYKPQIELGDVPTDYVDYVK